MQKVSFSVVLENQLENSDNQEQVERNCDNENSNDNLFVYCFFCFLPFGVVDRRRA